MYEAVKRGQCLLGVQRRKGLWGFGDYKGGMGKVLGGNTKRASARPLWSDTQRRLVSDTTHRYYTKIILIGKN